MLTLPIKKKWFDLIFSGEKTEEYREVKPYYNSRFKDLDSCQAFKVRFRNGYSHSSPTLECTARLFFGTGREEWGAEKGKTYYVLRIEDKKVL